MEAWEQWSEAADELALNMNHTRGTVCTALAILHGTRQVSLTNAKDIMKLAQVHGIDPMSAAKFVEAVVCG